MPEVLSKGETMSRVIKNRIRIIHSKCSTEIDTDNIAYSRIRNMYKTGDGVGVQAHPKYEKEIRQVCAEIVALLDKLNDINDKVGIEFDKGEIVK